MRWKCPENTNFIPQLSIRLNITFRNDYIFVLFHSFFSLLERIFRKEWRKMSIIKMLCEQWMSSNAPNETMIWMKARNLFCSSELEWFQLCAEKKFEACKRYCNCYCSKSNSFHWVKLAWQIPNEWFNVLVAVIQWGSDLNDYIFISIVSTPFRLRIVSSECFQYDNSNDKCSSSSIDSPEKVQNILDTDNVKIFGINYE